jgi:hypothetical protein
MAGRDERRVVGLERGGRQGDPDTYGNGGCGLVNDRWLRALYIATYAVVLLYSEVSWASLAFSGRRGPRQDP